MLLSQRSPTQRADLGRRRERRGALDRERHLARGREAPARIAREAAQHDGVERGRDGPDSGCSAADRRLEQDLVEDRALVVALEELRPVSASQSTTAAA